MVQQPLQLNLINVQLWGIPHFPAKSLRFVKNKWLIVIVKASPLVSNQDLPKSNLYSLFAFPFL